MNLKKWIKVAFMSGSVVMLAACSSAHRHDDSAINAANSSYNDGAQASGLGGDSTFGDRAGGGLSQRTYYFDYNSNVVRDADKPAILANANYLMSHPRAHVVVEGNTDPRGSREYNMGLGERRAKAVAVIMTSKGVNPAQIRVVSYGAEKLAAPGRSERDYQLDRRVVLVYA